MSISPALSVHQPQDAEPKFNNISRRWALSLREQPLSEPQSGLGGRYEMVPTLTDQDLEISRIETRATQAGPGVGTPESDTSASVPVGNG